MKSLATRVSLLLLPVLVAAQQPEGDWKGTLETNSLKLRLAFHIKKDAAGVYTGAIDSLDQGAVGIPADKVSFDAGKLRIEFPKLQAFFEGSVSADANTLTGEWSQRGNSVPMTLTRGVFAEAPKGRPLTGRERDFLIGHLERTRSLFLDSISGLTEAQWKFKAGPDRWSIAECAEHITVAEDFLFDITTTKIMKIPPAAEQVAKSEERLREDDEKILTRFADRSQKAQAPEPVRPTGRMSDAAEVKKAFTGKRDKTVQYARTTQDDVRNHAAAGPAGPMDAYQFLLMIAAHTERHVAQIQEVKGSPNYPK